MTSVLRVIDRTCATHLLRNSFYNFNFNSNFQRCGFAESSSPLLLNTSEPKSQNRPLNPDIDKSKAVIFHMVPRGRTLPNPSPFVLKLWTYLRMSKIPYKIDTKNWRSPKGKSPWITYEGENVTDSQICIEYLGKKFGKDFGKVYSAEQLAVSRATRIMLEEHFYWGSALWRCGTGAEDAHKKVYKLKDTFLINLSFRVLFLYKIRRAAWAQGAARLPTDKLIDIMCDDLRSVSTILGKKKYILGDTPCEDDCAIFGALAQAYWGLPNSPYEKLVKEDLINIRDYCERMKSEFWPDWNNELAR